MQQDLLNDALVTLRHADQDGKPTVQLHPTSRLIAEVLASSESTSTSRSSPSSRMDVVDSTKRSSPAGSPLRRHQPRISVPHDRLERYEARFLRPGLRNPRPFDQPGCRVAPRGAREEDRRSAARLCLLSPTAASAIIEVPKGVSFTVDGKILRAKGPLGAAQRPFPSDILELKVAKGTATLTLLLPPTRKASQALLGTWAAHVRNLAGRVDPRGGGEARSSSRPTSR